MRAESEKASRTTWDFVLKVPFTLRSLLFLSTLQKPIDTSTLQKPIDTRGRLSISPALRLIDTTGADTVIGTEVGEKKGFFLNGWYAST